MPAPLLTFAHLSDTHIASDESQVYYNGSPQKAAAALVAEVNTLPFH